MFDESTFKHDQRHETRPDARGHQDAQIRWYRCPVDKKVLRSLVAPMMRGACSWRWGILASGRRPARWPSISSRSRCGPVFVALFFHGTVGSFFTAPHPLCHRTIFRTKR